MMKPRIRARSTEPRKHSLPIRFNDSEYQLITDAAAREGITPATFMAEVALKQAERVLKRKFEN